MLFGVVGILVFGIALALVILNKPQNGRPQEPSKPYPYYSEDVELDNPLATVSLAGTLTLPSREGTYPAVILVSGSGPQTRRRICWSQTLLGLGRLLDEKRNCRTKI